MDWLNSYGVRLLMPFSNRWFYGDALYIVDPVPVCDVRRCRRLVATQDRRGVHPRRARPARLGLAVAGGLHRA